MTSITEPFSERALSSERALPLEKLLKRSSERLLLIAGPCQIESEAHCLSVAERLIEITRDRPVSLVFKSSFDKANRTSAKGARGAGIDSGLKALPAVRSTFGLPVITDIHLPEQAAPVSAVADILQVPAFLCRQTDLLIAAGETGSPIMVKKGQFLHPSDMQHVADKIRSTGNEKIFLCERGTSLGYRDLVVDMRSLVIMRSLGYPVVFDGTHSVQQIGSAGGSSGGLREFIPPLVRAAVAVGVDGIFLECHEEPARAPSDGASMLPLDELSALLDVVVPLWQATQSRSSQDPYEVGGARP